MNRLDTLYFIHRELVQRKITYSIRAMTEQNNPIDWHERIRQCNESIDLIDKLIDELEPRQLPLPIREVQDASSGD